MLRPWRIYFYLNRGELRAGLSPKGSAKHPAGIRSLVYGVGKSKGGIEGFERVGGLPRCNDLPRAA